MSELVRVRVRVIGFVRVRAGVCGCMHTYHTTIQVTNVWGRVYIENRCCNKYRFLRVCWHGTWIPMGRICAAQSSRYLQWCSKYKRLGSLDWCCLLQSHDHACLFGCARQIPSLFHHFSQIFVAHTAMTEVKRKDGRTAHQIRQIETELGLSF